MPAATGTTTEPANSPLSVAGAFRALARYRPLALYERAEGVAALMSALPTTPASMLGLLRSAPAVRRWSGNPAGIVVAGARKHPGLSAIVDDDEIVTYADLERRTNVLARMLVERDIGPGATIGILSHNRALLVEAMMAGYKTGANIVMVNSAFSPPQIDAVVAAEGIDLLICDAPLGEALATYRRPLLGAREIATAAHGGGGELPAPAEIGRLVVLTSGTTGTPRGAQRSGSVNALDAAGIISCIPFAAGDTTLVAAPLFHGLGLFNANLTLALGSTLILRSKFSAEQTLADIQTYHVATLVAVPAMLQRIMALSRRELTRYDCSSLGIVVCGGAPLSAELAAAFTERFGDVLYNVYGATETALATVATPGDLRRAPGTAGYAVPGVTVRVLDDEGRSVPAGEIGQVFVGSRLRFDGYTGGTSKTAIDGLLATGDLGRLDRWGRLFIEGRQDEMIVSGGENVHPVEVEECLMTHRAVAEAAVIGVPDAEFGQRLKAFVVRTPRSRVSEEALKHYVHERLARFKTPREVVFVDRLPRTSTGKVLKRELA